MDLELQALEKEMEKLRKEYEKKFDLIVQAKTEGNEKLVNQFKERQSDINKLLLHFTEKKGRLENNKAKAKEVFQFDLFNQSTSKKTKSPFHQLQEALQAQIKILKASSIN